MPHAVAQLRAQRLAQSQRPFKARGIKLVRCERCRVARQFCICAWQPQASSEVGVCLLMHDIEPLKPSNTGWLIADVVQHTFAFTWSRTQVEPKLLALLADPKWQPLVVFPEEYAAPEQQVVHQLRPLAAGKKPLFIILDATWMQARKMFRKSAYLAGLPVLSLQPEQLSNYLLRRSTRDDHLCTAEVAVLCLELAQELTAAEQLHRWLERFTEHYLAAKTPPPAAQLGHYQAGSKILAKESVKRDKCSV
ncbi:tRNA-uridine aminocarboxypropyltransferase [Thiopseudomonas alkaliphila]|uniref:tRNA-uridine aminocarboxypropyltransferase n=1 Tax=Thiopseudomonas alkaliphila TaxID=1697053 RepID=UPI0009BA4235|nr:tRNA-uridine aminocarboxypropyltransferase [Thiopseudomonas alkaliphila]